MAHKHPNVCSKPYLIFVSLIISALLLASCGLLSSPAATPVPPSPTPQAGAATQAPVLASSPTPLDTPQPPTDTPQVVLDTPTSLPSPTPLMVQASVATVLPVSTLLPASTPQSSASTFSLITGTTAGVIQGTVQAGQVLSYTLGAGQAQPITLIMDSPNNDVTLGVLDPNGNILLSTASRERSWQMALPINGLYTVQVVGGSGSESFTLTIKLPVVVSFASGASSTTLSGTTVNGYLFSYSLNCASGQTMSAALAQPTSTATIDIYGLTSGTLVDASAGYNSWSGILPQTQDYIIEVVPTNNQVINYNLTVSCTGTPGNNYVPYSPTGNNPPSGGQLYFYPDETMSVVQGHIAPGQVVTYTVSAKQYQALILILGSPNGDAVLGVIDPSGNQMLDPVDQRTYWQWTLPMTGLYTIQVAGGITAETFTLTTKVAPVLTYPANGNSIYQYRTTTRGLIKSYAFRLSTGVYMTLSLNVPATVAYLDVFGVQTGSILNASTRATTWTGIMPSTQEYVVEVIPGGTLSAYTLTISNP